MNHREWLQWQAIQLRQLLEKASDNPILAPQLAQRLNEIEQQLGRDWRRREPPIESKRRV